eukprot:SAG22_NODE_8_length_37215_cov_120.960351_29_plen_359_part_00
MRAAAAAIMMTRGMSPAAARGPLHLPPRARVYPSARDCSAGSTRSAARDRMAGRQAARRRLRAVYVACAAAAAPAAAPAAEAPADIATDLAGSSDPSSAAAALRQGGPLGLPLARQDRRGQLTPDSVAELAGAMSAAAARLDFRAAAALKQTLDVLGPKPGGPPPLSAFTSDDPDKAADIFFEHGFCVLPAAIAPGDVLKMRAAYEQVAAASRQADAESWAAGADRKDLGRFYGFPMFEPDGGRDPAFYALLDPPLLMQLLHRALGRPALVSGGGGRVVPVSDSEAHATDGYISWHRVSGCPWPPMPAGCAPVFQCALPPAPRRTSATGWPTTAGRTRSAAASRCRPICTTCRRTAGR